MGGYYRRDYKADKKDMKLAAVYNTWNDWDLLNLSIKNILPVVDWVIVVSSFKSNYGEADIIPPILIENPKVFYDTYEPPFHVAMHSETAKRNYGLDLARKSGATHYISMDADEFYDQQEFKKSCQAFRENDSLAGFVCKSRVYFSRPDLTIGMDTTLVPFVHKITPALRHEFNKNYPFAWKGRQILIDPTRSFNIDSGVEMSPIIMEHMSWVRKDMEAYKRKIRNSTARANLERSNILQDLVNAKEGYFCHFYQKQLVRVPNRFNIPYGDLSNEDIQPVETGNA